MASDEERDPAAIVLHFPAPTWRFRLANHLRGLARPRSLLALTALAVIPRLVVEAALPDPGSALRTFTLALGAGVCLLIVAFGTLAAVVQGFPARTLTFTHRGVQQEVRGAIEMHGWEWIVDFSEDHEALEIMVQPPAMRSFQLAKAAPQRLVVPTGSVDEETIAALRALLDAHARGRSG